ncbi:MAG: DUF58 domain-containing protein [Alcanivoracaceae bacterium]|nr:DUF58 domain-containing protein [Alcanivoracaceae bacterium]
MIRASTRLIRLAALWAITALLPVIARQLDSELASMALALWAAAGVLLLVVLLLDIVLAWKRPIPNAERRLPAALSLQQLHPVKITLSSAELPREFEVADQHPNDDFDTGLPKVIHKSELPVTEFTYHYRPSQRGKAMFSNILLWLPSPLGLISKKYEIEATRTVPVYPDFSVLQRDALHAHQDSRLDPGSRRQPRRGEGFEFNQLREYNNGDSLRQIDWKASARRRKLISREYQEEQNQQLIVLLDGGERLAMAVNGLTGFDHALNATLLLAWSTLKQQDKPGVMLFSSDTPCWVPPVRGPAGANTILNSLYAMQPGSGASDYSKAAEQLLRRWKKHSLVVMITRLQPDDEPEILAAIKLLAKRHLLLIADIQLPEQLALQHREINDTDDALLVAGDAAYQESRRALYSRLRHAGALVTDAAPEQLPARLNQMYLSLKRSGRI